MKSKYDNWACADHIKYRPNKKDSWDSGEPRRQQILSCDIEINVVITHWQIYIHHTDLRSLCSLD